MADVTIVFRKRDGTNTGKIYVNGYEAAAELASKYRNACDIVDVISKRDEVTLRWEGGHPDWKNGEVKPIKLTGDVYQFKRPEDAFWVPENRLSLLTSALQYAFDVVTNQASEYAIEELLMQTEHHGGDDIWPMIAQAKHKAEQLSPEADSSVWEAKIADWMANPDKLFIHYLVEHAALWVHTGEDALAGQIPRLGVRLAEIAATKKSN